MAREEAYSHAMAQPPESRDPSTAYPTVLPDETGPWLPCPQCCAHGEHPTRTAGATDTTSTPHAGVTGTCSTCSVCRNARIVSARTGRPPAGAP